MTMFSIPLAVALLGAAEAPVPPLPALPVIARVRLDVAEERVLVVYEIVMARGDWAGGNLDLWMSFGPVMPRAVDARLLSVSETASAPSPTDEGEPIPVDMATRRPRHTHALLGPTAMAGAVLHLREPAFRRATSAGHAVGLRIRQVLPPPVADETTSREIVLRLGMEGSTPLTLRRIDLTTSEQSWLTTASAQLCGPDADPHPLGFSTAPTHNARDAIEPALATRRDTYDLCIRYQARR